MKKTSPTLPHVLARREAERREREAAALFVYDDDDDPGCRTTDPDVTAFAPAKTAPFT